MAWMTRSFGRGRGRRQQLLSASTSAPRPVETLESRVFLAAHPIAAIKQAQAADRVNPTLLEIHDALAAGLKLSELAASKRIVVDAAQERIGVTIRAADVNRVTKALA